MQPREIDDPKGEVAEPIMSRRRQQTASVETGACECMRAQDASGVEREARNDSLTRNRRDPTRPPSSGQSAAYKPSAKWRGAGRESERLVVPMTAAAITPPEGRGLTLVAHGVGVSVRAWPAGPTTPSKKHENSSSCTLRQPSTDVEPSSRGLTWPAVTRRSAVAVRPPSEGRMLRYKTIGQPCAGKPHARLERGPQAFWVSRKA